MNRSYETSIFGKNLGKTRCSQKSCSGLAFMYDTHLLQSEISLFLGIFSCPLRPFLLWNGFLMFYNTLGYLSISWISRGKYGTWKWAQTIRCSFHLQLLFKKHLKKMLMAIFLLTRKTKAICHNNLELGQKEFEEVFFFFFFNWY